MHTYLPADSTIKAYLKDYLQKLDLADDTEDRRARLSKIVWVPLGNSGAILVKRLWELLPGSLKNYCVSFHPTFARYDRKIKQMSFPNNPFPLDSPETRKRFENREVIVLDSSVHSGESMRTVCNFIQTCSPQLLSTSTLFLKRGAKIVPNYFALLIYDWDRPLFWLQEIPVNRLDKFAYRKNIQLVRLEDSKDVADLDYEEFEKERKIVCVHFEGTFKNQAFFHYVCLQKGTVCGRLAFQWIDDSHQEDGCRIHLIDVIPNVASDIVLLLVRWAETCARHNRCSFIELSCSDADTCRRLVEMGFSPVEGTEFLRRRIIHAVKTFTAFPDDDPFSR